MSTTTDSKFAVAFVINAVLAIVFTSLFMFFRKRVPQVYEPRCLKNSVVNNKLSTDEESGVSGDGAAAAAFETDHDTNAPPSPPASLFGWIVSTVKYRDETLLCTHGMDAMMFVKFLKMMFWVCLCQMVFGVVILFPVNATGENTEVADSDELHVSGLSRLTMSSIATRSNRLLAAFFSIMFNSGVVYYFSHKLFRSYMHYRIHTRVAAEKVENYVVMVREVPLKAGKEEDLQKYFERIYPGKVLGVIRARSTSLLDKKLAEREKFMISAEKATCIFEQTGERPTNKDKFLIGNKVDSIEWYTQHYNKKSETVTKLQDNEWPLTGVAFVIFSDLATSVQCAQTILHRNNKYMTAAAPDPRDIQWSKLSINHHHRLIRTTVVNVFMFFLVFFWAIPVTFVSGLSNLSTISQVPGFGFLVDILSLNTVILGFVEGFLPTLALVIFYALLVTIITAVSNLQGLYTQSRLSRSVMSKYFVFQVFNTFLVYSIAGSIFNVIDKLVNNPTSVVSLLATSLPQQNTFFTNYIMLLSMSGHAKSLFRPAPLIIRWVKQRWLCKTPREYRAAENPGTFNYGTSYATHLLILVIIFTYSTLSPFLLIFGVLYAMFAYLSQKYNILYVYNIEYEGGGAHWPLVFNRMCVGLLIYQIVLLGEFISYSFIPGIVAAAICLAATLIFWKHTTDQYSRTAEMGALDIIAIPESYTQEVEPKEEIPSDEGEAPVDTKVEVQEVQEIQKMPSRAVIVPKDEKGNRIDMVEAYLQPSLIPIKKEL